MQFLIILDHSLLSDQFLPVHELYLYDIFGCAACAVARLLLDTIPRYTVARSTLRLRSLLCSYADVCVVDPPSGSEPLYYMFTPVTVQEGCDEFLVNSRTLLEYADPQ